MPTVLYSNPRDLSYEDIEKVMSTDAVLKGEAVHIDHEVDVAYPTIAVLVPSGTLASSIVKYRLKRVLGMEPKISEGREIVNFAEFRDRLYEGYTRASRPGIAAYVIDEGSRKEILKAFPPKYSNILCHHITHNLLDLIAPEDAKIEIIGYADGDGIECLTVTVNGETKRPDGGTYHITMSHDDAHRPKDSNKIVDDATPCDGPAVSVTSEVMDKVTEAEKPEFIDPDKTDMKADFEEINRKMFGGEVKMVPLRWMTTKNRVGLMTYTKEGEIESLGVSKFYRMTRQQYLNVLAHEMIHVWMEQKGVREKDPHGSKFQSKVEDLNSRFPEFRIKKTEHSTEFTVATTKAKEYCVALFDEGDAQSVVIANRSASDGAEEFIETMSKHAHKFRKLKISVYISDYNELSGFKVKKSLSIGSGLALYSISHEMAAEIKKGELVAERSIK